MEFQSGGGIEIPPEAKEGLEMARNEDFKGQTREIAYNVVNSLLAGALVLAGAFLSGKFTVEVAIAAIAAASKSAIIQIKDYWSKEKSEYCSVLFSWL